MNQDQLDAIYRLGGGTYDVTVRLSRVYGPEPTIKYEGPAKLTVESMDRSKQSKSIRRYYPLHDFWLTVSEPVEWAQYARSDNTVALQFMAEDYLMEIIRFPALTEELAKDALS